MPTQPKPKPRRHQWPQDLGLQCVYKHNSGLKYGKIATQLNIPKASVAKIIRYYKKHGHALVSQRSGRPRMTDVRQDRRIVREVEENRSIIASRLAAQAGTEIAYAKKYETMTEVDWEEVLFTDEAMVEIHGTTGRVSVWRRTHEAIMHLRTPPRRTKRVLRDLILKALTHPTQSPDLNPIENIWAIMKWEFNKTPATSLEDLKQKLPKICNQIHDDVMKRAVRFKPKRLDAVKQAKGCHTKY
ncbi:putative transposable element tc3 transposase [Phytophthora infestans]|uniref:Putative transposable element tc3 transposase n=1 Tax=Phytophthora infestans TaxID=4787 RepID=A0A833W596_PHYIN|nr:putative transposable element tc3 transposase [Phytophthora infestans]KAF4132210.1 putative transposable element tc3 transposase [Phytophthora infestans]